ncbi:MAG: type II toxin-antitoxin system RelE/ParE family toxin [Bacteroidota bacterium]|nr:type II toxin-antitoxin system RelE/ParE family toxin [Bacteroidota bacterium]
MIASFKHKELEKFFLKGDGSKLQPNHLKKIRRILSVLNTAYIINDINIPAFDLHSLKGASKGIWSVSVNGNYRIPFSFNEAKVEVLDVDYLDYH